MHRHGFSRYGCFAPLSERRPHVCAVIEQGPPGSCAACFCHACVDVNGPEQCQIEPRPFSPRWSPSSAPVPAKDSKFEQKVTLAAIQAQLSKVAYCPTPAPEGLSASWEYPCFYHG